MASLSASHDTVLVMASDGTLAGDVRPLVRLNVSVIIEHEGRREQGYAGGGGRFAYTEFLASERWRDLVREAVRTAQVNLEAVPAPAGTMTVVLGAGWPGVLLHEAVGHGLEGDFNRKGTSAFSGRIGQQVAAQGVTIVDDGTLEARRGSLNVDDEGTPTQCTVLIENGILKGYLQDKLNARLMGVKPTGNGRRESYAHMTMPRMTNTYMLPGAHAPEEIIASVSKGLYCRNFGGGQVDITSGKFVFSASEAYLIENGRVTRPVKGATLIGNGPEVMTRISMVGNDLQARRRRRHLRQGRAGRAGGRRPADAARRRSDGRRHGLTIMWLPRPVYEADALCELWRRARRCFGVACYIEHGPRGLRIRVRRPARDGRARAVDEAPRLPQGAGGLQPARARRINLAVVFLAVVARRRHRLSSSSGGHHGRVREARIVRLDLA